MKKSNIIRALTLLVLLAYVFVFLAVSFSYVIEHSCTDGECLICLFISVNERIARIFLAVTAVFNMFFVCAGGALTVSVPLNALHATPVCLKVKLSN